MYVPNSNEFEFWEVEGDVFEVAEVDQIEFEAFYLADVALQNTVGAYFAAHILFACSVCVKRGEFFPVQVDSAFPVLFPDLAGIFLLQQILQFFMIDILQKMLEIFIIRALKFNLDNVSVILILDDEVKRRDDFEYTTECDFLHAIINLSLFKSGLHLLKNIFASILSCYLLGLFINVSCSLLGEGYVVYRAVDLGF